MSDICEVTWNRKLVSVICRVTWFIIRPTIWNEFDIVCIKLWAFFFFFKFYMLSVKFNYAAPFSLLKLFQSWFHPLVRSFDLLGTFLLVFCLWLFNISSICSQDVFDPVKCKAQGFFATAFIAVSGYLTQCFAVFLIVEVFTFVIVFSKAIACFWKFFMLVVFSCLYRSWNFFYREVIGV